ncbi:T9SS type A sorting domain-containing protein [Marivirga harenae]|uniref:T9SS type A sorting domain-containing protein n=1 Tax=Marivirga harenae TaxID=2010992 RepID=UPI0026DFCE64|nr:T9SS type A sorting domain-containing protein [Marivirga harenae]WKV12069.1 T9SS type A sorting domain-containing protein [Marivirga harenae]
MKFSKNILLIFFISFSISFANAEKDSLKEKAVDIEIIKILKEAEVYPNPAEDFIYLKINEGSISSEISIEVMSIIGNKMSITHEKINPGLYKINLKNIPSGHYYVMLTVDTDKSLKKFIKK